MGLHFQNRKNFWNIMGSTYDYSINKKTILWLFYLFISKVTTTKVKLRFYKQCTVKPQHFLFTNKPFLRKMLESYFSCIISLYIEKNPVEKLCKVLEMEPERHTCVDLKFHSEKTNLKFCFIFNMISFTNAQGSIKIILACSKFFETRRQIFLFYRSRCCKCFFKIILFIM